MVAAKARKYKKSDNRKDPMKTLVISNQFIKKILPAFEKDYEASYSKLTKILKNLIVSKEEDKKFFAGPIAYLRRQGALPFEEIALSSRAKFPIVDDVTLAKTIRKGRELYEAGKLSIKTVDVGFMDCGTTRFLMIFSSRIIKPSKGINPFSNIMPCLEADIAVWGRGRNELVIDGLTIGPLVNPKVLEGFREAVGKQMLGASVRNR
jgi:hypothetical protein